MALSNTYRILLILLLPVIAVLIYHEGQKYDPALIRFDSAESEEDSLSSIFPREIEGYRLAGQVISYTKENLYEYVNGHAEYFISAGFKGLAVGDYIKEDSDVTRPDAVVDIYDMGSGIQAFGVLSDESGGNLSELNNGLTGFRTPSGVGFVKGRYYIRIARYSDEINLESFTVSIAGAIETEADPFTEFAALPDIGDIVSTRFIKEAYRGLDFVNNVLEREYVLNGGSVQVFVVAGGREKIDKLTGDFIDYFHESDIRYSVSVEKEKKAYRIEDPYEGDWVMISTPDALFGIFGALDDRIINLMLTEH